MNAPTNPDLLRSLEKGWDSYDAEPISEEAIRTAENLCFVPLPDGGIQIEMHAGGLELEIEIAPDGRVSGVVLQQRP